MPGGFEHLLEEMPQELSQEEKLDWMKQLQGVALCSDGFFPFKDNIERARQVSWNTAHGSYH